MHIHSLLLENVRSFRDQTLIEFPEGLTILVGPNAGGKSNLLDILTTVLRAYFFYSYYIEQSTDERGAYRSIQVSDSEKMKTHIKNVLSKYDDNVDQQAIEITFVVDEEDLSNIKLLRSNREKFSQALQGYRNGRQFHIESLDQWNVTALHPGEKIKYRIFEHIFSENTPEPQDTSRGIFLHYLQKFELFTLIAREMGEIILKAPFLYLSPFRGAQSSQSFEVNLSGRHPTAQLVGYDRATSRQSTSLIALAISYFAAKRRQLESAADEAGWQNRWESDTEVQLVTKYLNRLGYSWQLQLIDSMQNVYSIDLEKHGRYLDVAQASSGEIEMLNFVLGIFVHNLKNGVLLLDEAELHLHPKWQNLLLDILQELSLVNHNQIILSTHSATFLTVNSIESVIRVYKDGNISKAIRLADREDEKFRDIINMINAHNNERMFFADKVVLVEGITDRLILERFIALYTVIDKREQFIEVLEVRGKTMFSKYRPFLEAMGVIVFQMADLDYISIIGKTPLDNLLVIDMDAVEKKVLKDKKSVDRYSLAQEIDRAIITSDLAALQKLWHYIKARHTRLPNALTDEQQNLVTAFFEEQRRNGVFILTLGEIEDYLPAGLTGRTSLDRVIELLENNRFEDWIRASWSEKAVVELREIAMTVVGVDEATQQALDQKFHNTRSDSNLA